MNKIIPINVDRNVSFFDYSGLEENDYLLLTKAWYTLQGEGPLAGRPAVFARFAGCNLGDKEDCPFCDTKFNFDDGTPYTFEQLKDEILRLAAGKTQLVVITGGEPLLQQKALARFMNYFAKNGGKGWRFQIETNGYFLRENTFDELKADDFPYMNPPLFVISPKVAATLGRYPKARKEWFDYNFHSVLKYVVSADPESPYHTVPEEVVKACRASGTALYVSPMAVYLKSYPKERISSIWHTDEIDQKATAENYRYAGKYAMDNGFFLSIQSHLMVAVD